LHQYFNEDVDKSGAVYCLFNRLMKTRNSLVHSKSKDLNFADINTDFYLKKFNIINNGKNIKITDAIKVLFLMDKDIQSIKKSKHYYPYLFFGDYEHMENTYRDNDVGELIESTYSELFGIK
jgi:hypothetical protein